MEWKSGALLCHSPVVRTWSFVREWSVGLTTMGLELETLYLTINKYLVVSQIL